MNTDKLVKAIQIIVKEEIKEVLPKLVKEGVKREMAKLLKENKQLREAIKPQTPPQPTFMDSEPVMEQQIQSQKPLSKNPVLNEVLQQTQPFNSTQRQGTGAEYQTMNFTTNDTHTLGQQNIQQQMGYGKQPISTGNSVMDKLVNRDYSQILKAVEKKKGPWRPGMD